MTTGRCCTTLQKRVFQRPRLAAQDRSWPYSVSQTNFTGRPCFWYEGRLSDTVLLEDHLRRLRLPAMLRDYKECARQAREGGADYESFLLDLVSRELEQRQANQLKRRLKEARFPVMKTLETTDLKKWPSLEPLQVRELLQCEYITRHENLALIGRHGTGKSHAATVLGVEACRLGYRVLFSTAAQLVNTLVEGREERQLQRLDRFELVIIDELGHFEGKQDLQAKVMIALFGLFAEVERDLISERTKEGLAAARAKGRLPGRPKGALGKSKFDGKEEEIRILLQKQVSKASIAKIVGVSRTAMHHFINSRKLDPKASQPRSPTHRP